MQQAKAAGCSLLSLPECFDWIGTGPAAAKAIAQPLEGPLMASYRALCIKHRLACAYGGFHEQPPEAGCDDRIQNTHVVVSSAGKVLAAYRKTHLFDVDIADGIFLESSSTRPGAAAVLLELPSALSVGLTTCYDLRFPALFGILRAAGANLFLVPSAFMCRCVRVPCHCYLIDLGALVEMHWIDPLFSRAFSSLDSLRFSPAALA